MSEELVLDLSNYKDRVGSRVVPDTYRVQVEDAEMATSSNGNTMVNLWFTILEGEFQGQTVTDRLVITEKSMFRVVGFMQGIGLPTPKQKIKLNIRQFIGRVLDIEVDDGEPYNGRVRSEVRSYKRVAKAETEDLDISEEPAEEVQTAAPAEAVPAAASSVESDDLDLDSVEL